MQDAASEALEFEKASGIPGAADQCAAGGAEAEDHWTATERTEM